MAIYYCDGTNGSDSNNGTSWANAKQTFDGCCALSLQPGDVVRVAKSPDPISFPSATWTDKSATVTFDSAPTGLTTGHLIGKSGLAHGTAHEWWPIASINGNVVTLTFPYSGVTENVVTYGRTMISVGGQAISNSGSTGSLITFSCGWNTTTTEQDGHTFYNSSTGLVLYDVNFVRVERFSQFGGGFGIDLRNTHDSEFDIGCIMGAANYGIYIDGFTRNTLNVFSCNANSSYGFFGSDSQTTGTTYCTVDRVISNGIGVRFHHVFHPWVLTIDRIELNQNTGVDLESHKHGTIVINKILSNAGSYYDEIEEQWYYYGIGAIVHPDEDTSVHIGEVAYNGLYGVMIGAPASTPNPNTYQIDSIHDNGPYVNNNGVEFDAGLVVFADTYGYRTEITVGEIYNEAYPLYQEGSRNVDVIVDVLGTTYVTPIYVGVNTGSTFNYGGIRPGLFDVDSMTVASSFDNVTLVFNGGTFEISDMTIASLFDNVNLTQPPGLVRTLTGAAVLRNIDGSTPTIYTLGGTQWN